MITPAATSAATASTLVLPSIGIDFWLTPTGSSFIRNGTVVTGINATLHLKLFHNAARQGVRNNTKQSYKCAPTPLGRQNVALPLSASGLSPFGRLWYSAVSAPWPAAPYLR